MTHKRVLEPIDRLSEVLFALIMVLTFTGSLSAAEAGRADVGAMLIGALGCNLAWGLIDGVMYVMGCMAEQGRDPKAIGPGCRGSPSSGSAPCSWPSPSPWEADLACAADVRCAPARFFEETRTPCNAP